FLDLHPRLLSLPFVAHLDGVVGGLIKIDLKKASSLADAAMTIAEKLDDKECTAFSLRAKANALWSLRQNKQAAEFHGRAVQLFDEVRNPLEAGRTLSVYIQPLILLGEYERAHVAADRARKIFTALEDPVRLARLEINVGNIFHRQDRFREAL